MKFQSKHWLVLGGFFSFMISILHIAIIFGGAPAYRYFRAGEKMAQMALSGSVLPALLTFFIAAIFAIWGLYALSGAGVIRTLPLVRLGLFVIASIYTLRGIVFIPQIINIFNMAKPVLSQDIIFSVAALIVGIVHWIGIFTRK